ncbi:MAG TPA: phage baseplate assembly protein V [Acidimicrobiales bacterium]|nr:phage baseplate assembly protein V [Acidimicrobiales bacterium]
MNDTQQQFLDVVERFRSRFYGKYRGSVTAVDAGTFRIKAKVPAVLRDRETGWCTPCVPYAGKDVGIVFLPEEGAGVWIEFEGGDVSFPIWSGCYWRTDELPSDATPTVKAIVTASGHKVLLDDDAASITVVDDNGNEVMLDGSGVTLKRGRHTVFVGEAQVAVDDGAVQVQ